MKQFSLYTSYWYINNITSHEWLSLKSILALNSCDITLLSSQTSETDPQLNGLYRLSSQKISNHSSLLSQIHPSLKKKMKFFFYQIDDIYYSASYKEGPARPESFSNFLGQFSPGLALCQSLDSSFHKLCWTLSKIHSKRNSN